MKLDILTLAFITSIVFAVQTIAVFVQYRVNKTYSGLGWWLIGAILQAIGFFLMLALESPSFWELAILANPLIFSGQVFLYVGVRKFLGSKENRLVFVSLLALFLLAYFFFIVIRNSIFGRSVVVSSTAAAISTLIAFSLSRGKKRHFSGSARFTAAVFFAYGCVQATITLLTVLSPRLGSYGDFYALPFRTIAFIIPIIGSLLWTFGFIIMVNQRLNSENLEAALEIRKLLAEKELILKEVHHRIKNNMNTIYSLLSLQASSLKDPLSIAALEDTGNRIQSMMMVYETLYKSANFTELSVAEYLPPLIDEIMSNFPRAGSVKVERRVGDFVLDIKRLQPLGIIINELLTNIMKYAFSGGGDGDAILVTADLRDGRVAVVVRDNGVGMPESVDPRNSPGFGLTLVAELTKQLGGNLRIEREAGTKIILEFVK